MWLGLDGEGGTKEDEEEEMMASEEEGEEKTKSGRLEELIELKWQ
jgi:hypothetical protein